MSGRERIGASRRELLIGALLVGGTLVVGGTPALASEVWPGATDYVPGEPHDACGDEPGWTSGIPSRDVERAIRAARSSS